jgi:exoribonuclease R
MKLITKDYKQFEIGSGVGEGEAIIPVQFSSLDRVLPGDEVVSGGNNKWIACKRAHHPPLVGTIDLINKTRYGFTARNVPVYLFHPMNNSYPPFRVGSSIDPKCDLNYLAVVQFESWELGAGTPRGIVTQVLGPVGDEAAEQEALYWLYSPWSQYTKKTSVYEPIVDTKTARLDLTSPKWNTFNVDPVGCRDVDDVFSYTPYGDNDNGIQCVITIADVAAILPAGSQIDKIAKKIGQSLYCDGRKPRHMLPQSISEGHGSLLEGETRYGISLFFYLSQDNKVKEAHFEHTLIKCHKSYTYETFVSSPHAPILKRLCSILSPNSDDSDSHNWIAALMIYYNIEFAKVLANGREGVVGLLRSHSGPDMLRLKQLEAIDSDLTFLAQSSAKYIPANLPLTETGHYGLSAATYTHATSPLRRYADLYNQRIFKILLGLHQPLPVTENIANSLNEKAKAAKKHDRDAFWLHQLLLSDRRGGQIQAVIIGIKQKSEIIVAEAYCKEWKRVVKLRLKGILIDNGSLAQVKSRDEKREFVIGERDIITITCSFDMNRPHWTERIVFQLQEVYSLRGIPPTVPKCQ